MRQAAESFGRCRAGLGGLAASRPGQAAKEVGRHVNAVRAKGGAEPGPLISGQPRRIRWAGAPPLRRQITIGTRFWLFDHGVW